MVCSRNAAWDRVRNVEDVLAMLSRVEDRRKVIRLQAWHQGSFPAIYEEATRMQGELAELRELLGQVWRVWFAQVSGDETE